MYRDKGAKDAMRPQLAPGDWVTLHARHQPDAPCLVRPDGEVFTYAEVNRQVTRLAHALRDRGLAKGDRLGIVATDSPEYVMVQLACMKLAVTSVAINYRLAAPEVQNLLQTSQIDALIVESRYTELTAPSRAALADRLRVVATFDDPGPDGERFDGSFAELVAGASSDAEIESASTDEDILHLALTSGTTGTPKGVLQSQRMVKTAVVQGALELGLQPDDLTYTGAPLFHVSGIWHVLYGMSRGAAAMVTPQFEVDEVLRWLQSGRVRHAMLITSMVIALLEHPDVRNSPYTGLRSIMYGGAPMPPSVIREMNAVFKCDLYNGFGAGTEAAGQTMFRPADHRRALAGEEHLLGSIGRPIYGVDVKLCDPDGTEVAPGEVGEIYSRGDAVMSGYLNQPERSAQAVSDGWFHGGDLAWRDPDGFLFLAGRADDMIIRGGENVYPVEIEDVVSDHDSVAEVAVIGEPDAYYGETVTAIVRLLPGTALSYEELATHCRGRLGSYKIPSRLVVVEDLPRSQTGKIQKGVLRQRLRTGELA